MADHAQMELNEETERALGRFVIRFSGLLEALQTSTVWMFGLGPDGPRTILIQAALADRTASPIAASFFSVFYKKWESSLTAEDDAILKVLRKEINTLITERNRLMHDAWLGKTVGGDPGPHPMSRFRVRAHGRGVDYEITEYQPAQIDMLSANASRLASVVNASVWYHRPGQIGPELPTRLHVVEGKVCTLDRRQFPV